MAQFDACWFNNQPGHGLDDFIRFGLVCDVPLYKLTVFGLLSGKLISSSVSTYCLTSVFFSMTYKCIFFFFSSFLLLFQSITLCLSLFQLFHPIAFPSPRISVHCDHLLLSVRFVTSFLSAGVCHLLVFLLPLCLPPQLLCHHLLLYLLLSLLLPFSFSLSVLSPPLARPILVGKGVY